jgi:Ca-activated chloride channel homolog
MNELHLADPDRLYLLWLLPLLLGIYVYRFHKIDRALAAFSEIGLLRRINFSVSRFRQWCKAFVILGVVLFMIIALTRPGWNPRSEKIERKGRDIVFVLDVSRSMLAEDLKPNRLERARLAILDLIDRLEGDRVALVVFAGSSVLKCPLTQDYGFFRFTLDDISVDSVTRGGTLIGDALRMTLKEVLNDRLKRFKDIILITDGEDHESFPVEAAKEVGNAGTRLIAIGLGDENEGQRIPSVSEKGERGFLRYQDKEVWSRLDAATLREMVDVTPGGRYVNVATGEFDLGSMYQNLVASAEKRELESASTVRYEEKFQIFLALGMLLLMLEMLLSERRKTG